MPRQHLSPIRVPRSPYSLPPLRTWPSLGWEHGLALLRHPARVSPASPRTTTYSSSETTICASQLRLSEILELPVSPKTNSPPTVTALGSPFELETAQAGVHGSYARDFDYSSFLHAYSCPSPSLTPMLSSRPVSLHLSDTHDISPTDSFGRSFGSTSRRLSRTSTNHGHDPSGTNADADASTVADFERREMLIFPPSHFSARLRRLAPPPLLLSPLQHPAIQRRRSFANDAGALSAPLVDIPLASAAPQAQSMHALDTHRPAVTAIEFPEGSSTSFSSFEILQWRRRVSRVFEPPLTPLAQESAEGSEVPVLVVVSPSAPASPMEPSPRSSCSDYSNYTRFDEPPMAPASADTSVANSPPPPGRTRLISLPPIPYACSSGNSEALLSPLIPDLRTALAVSSLVTQAERCAEAVGGAAMCLCSCNLLKEPEAIFDLCKSIQRALHAVQQGLDATPDVRTTEETPEMQAWFKKHGQLISSLERNLNVFYQFADQLRARPPRIHRLVAHLNKLHAFRDKFADVARRLAVSHQKLHLVGLRGQFYKEHRVARAQADSERKRRSEFRVLWAEGRARRDALRNEIKYAKAREQHIRHTFLADHGLL